MPSFLRVVWKTERCIYSQSSPMTRLTHDKPDFLKKRCTWKSANQFPIQVKCQKISTLATDICSKTFHRRYVNRCGQRDKEILKKLHAAHQGAEKMKLRAYSAVFWNGINKDTDQTASHSTECQEAQPRQTREELEPTDISPYAWHLVGADLFFLDNADYYEYGFKHIKPSPHYPQSNGFIESQVKIVKKVSHQGKEIGSRLCSYHSLSSHHADRREVEVTSGTTVRTTASGQPPASSREKRRWSRPFRTSRSKARTTEDLLWRASTRYTTESCCAKPACVIRNESTNKWNHRFWSLLTSIDLPSWETPQGKTLRRNRIDIRPVPPKQVRFEVPASKPQPTQHPSPEVSQKASQAAATPFSTPGVSSAVQTRSGRTVKVPDKLNLWDNFFFSISNPAISLFTPLFAILTFTPSFLLLYEGDVVIWYHRP